MKKFKVNRLINSLTIVLLFFAFISCEKQIQEESNSPELTSEPISTLKSTTSCSVNLIAAQQFVIGDITTEFNDAGDMLTVTYTITDYDWCLFETHLDVQLNPINFPQTKNGNPKVGHFAYGEVLNCSQSWVDTIDLNNIEDWEEGMTLYIASHAEVSNNESAWGEGDPFPGSNWAMYFECEPPYEWECGDPIIDERDGQSYNTVQIGDQCWMADNLNVGTMTNGSQNMANNGTIEKYCYNNDPSNCETYGGLYQWYEMMQYGTTPGTQGICPNDWHIPSDNEWCELTQFIDPTVNCGVNGLSGNDVGIKMKNTSGWNLSGNGTNTSGFTALPGGNRNHDGNFYSLGISFNAWSTTTEYGIYPWIRDLYSYHDNVGRHYFSKYEGYSVRCIKD